MTFELGIVGAGQMAEAIVRGVLRAKLFSPGQMIAADVAAPRRELFQSQLGIKSVEDNADVARQSRIILLSVKPYQMQQALGGIGAMMDPQTLVISIAAGISSASIENHLGEGKRWRVIRTMPNTPILLGEGMVGMAAGRNATADDLATAQRLFEAAATVVEVREDQIDAVTALSGSGPAYFYFLVEQMIEAGVALGLSEEQARILASKTAAGAARMMLETADTPRKLRRKVTTPNGTTHAAITHLESAGWPQITQEAVKAAARRSRELGV